MDSRLRQGIDFACHVVMGIEVRRIKRFLRPVQNRLQNTQLPLGSLELRIRLSVVIPGSFGRFRISRIPDEIRHHRLELSAGDEGVSADFRILFDYDDRIPILNCLRCRSQAGAAAADDDDIIGFLNRIASRMFHGLLLECREIGYASLFCRIIQSCLDGSGGEGRTGNGINSGSACFLGIRKHNVIRHIADMSGFAGCPDLNVINTAVRERDIKLHRAIVTFRAACISSCLEAQSSIRIRGCCPLFGRINRSLNCSPYAVGSHRRTGYAIDVGTACIQNLLLQFFQRSSADRRCLTVACQHDIRDLAIVKCDICSHYPAEALCFAMVGSGLAGSC